MDTLISLILAVLKMNKALKGKVEGVLKPFA